MKISANALLSDPEVPNQLAYISANFCFLIASIDGLQEADLSLVRALEIFELSQFQGDSGLNVKQKLKAVMEKNPELKEMRKTPNILIGRNEDTELSPNVIAGMKFAFLSTVEVEKSFSIEKAI